MASLAKFSQRMFMRSDNLGKNTVVAVRRVSKRALRELVNGTPQDTGKTVSNWRVGLGAPTRSVIPAYAPGHKLGIGHSANAGPAISAGLAVIDRLRARTGPLTVHISNNARALPFLRAGHSASQQSGDWVLEAIQSARAELRGIRWLS